MVLLGSKAKECLSRTLGASASPIRRKDALTSAPLAPESLTGIGSWNANC